MDESLQTVVNTTPQGDQRSQKLRTQNKLLLVLVVILFVVLLAIVSVFSYFQLTKSAPSLGGVTCTTEVKECPDGSFVGRIGPKCEFEDCPNVAITTVPTDANQSQLGRFTDQMHGVEFEYPLNGYSIKSDGIQIRVTSKEDDKSPLQGSTMFPKIEISFVTSEETQSDYEEFVDRFIKHELGRCEDGMGCEVLPLEKIGEHTYRRYIGPSYVIKSSCYIAENPVQIVSTQGNSILATVCDVGFGVSNDQNSKALKDILSSLTFKSNNTTFQPDKISDTVRELAYVKDLNLENEVGLKESTYQPWLALEYIIWLRCFDCANGYKIITPDLPRLELPISNNPTIVAQTYSNGPDGDFSWNQQINLEEFMTWINKRHRPEDKGIPFWITSENRSIIKIEEQFHP